MVAEVIRQINHSTAVDRAIRLEVGRWETDAYPGFHLEGPQAICDEVLKIEDCDILVGIFWTRFGTPTVSGETGTEHEIAKAVAAWRQYNRPQVNHPDPAKQAPTFLFSMIFAPRQPRHLRSGRRVTLQRMDSNNFTRNWLRSYKNTSSPPPCTTLPNSAQSCLVRLRRKHSAFSRELGPLRPASSVPGVVSDRK